MFTSKKIITKLKNLLYVLINEFIVRQKGITYVRLFNLRSILINSPSRVNCKKEKYLFIDKKIKGITRFCRQERQASMSYHKGFADRANTIAECYMLKKIKFNNGDRILDCGANVGDLKLWFELNHKEIEYIGFEPGPIEYENLCKNVIPSKTFNIGLWNKDSQLTFYISSQNADSSIITPSKYDKKITIPSRKLSNYIDSNIKLLKLEAEGAEPEILEGVLDKLNLIEYITADVGYERGIRQESTIVPVINTLLSNNFEMIDIYNKHRVCVLLKNKSYS